jgi:cell division protein FtsB
LGVSTGNSNTLGNENTFLGAHAGYNNNLGNNNTFVGNFAGLVNTAGTNNTFIGFYAGASSSNLTNATAIGTGAIANADNSVMIGNTDVTSIGGQVSWSTFSDRRLKHSFQESELGLNFILSLKPVSYEYKASGQAGIRYTGLIAQDVEKSLKKLNTQFSGLVRPKNKNDFYSIRYGDFVVPLIKSIQEQQEQINQLKSENEMLLERIEKLEQKLK